MQNNNKAIRGVRTNEHDVGFQVTHTAVSSLYPAML